MHYELVNSSLVPGRKSVLGLGQNSTFKIQNSPCSLVPGRKNTGSLVNIQHSKLSQLALFRFSLLGAKRAVFQKHKKGMNQFKIQNSTFKITSVPLFFC